MLPHFPPSSTGWDNRGTIEGTLVPASLMLSSPENRNKLLHTLLDRTILYTSCVHCKCTEEIKLDVEDSVD